jgi:hypothetical protein
LAIALVALPHYKSPTTDIPDITSGRHVLK